jgi:signal transduction histidine kinase
MRQTIFNTTAFRLSVGYMFLVTLAVAVTLGTAYLLTDGLITDEVDVIIDTELKSLQDRFAQTGIPGVTDEINLRVDSWGRIGAVYMLVDSNFERIAGNVTHWPFDTLPTQSRPEFEIATIEPGRRAVHPVRAAVRTLPGGDHLLVGTDISQGRRFAEKFRIAMLWGIGLTSLAAALTGFWFSYRLARRVGDVTGTCKRILAGELGRRLPVTFDSAAHDLRAPLHRLRTRMDALLLRVPPLEPAVHESIESALREVDHLQRTLAILLQIALAESGAPLASPAAVDVGELATELAELFEPVVRDRGLILVDVAETGAIVQGNRQLLAQLVTNLIENCLKYVPAGGRIDLSVKRLTDSVCLVVSDDGPGVPADDRMRAVQPFVRIGQSGRPDSSGLGLSLVSAIARLHRARLSLENNEPGLRVVVELPLK